MQVWGSAMHPTYFGISEKVSEPGRRDVGLVELGRTVRRANHVAVARAPSTMRRGN